MGFLTRARKYAVDLRLWKALCYQCNKQHTYLWVIYKEKRVIHIFPNHFAEDIWVLCFVVINATTNSNGICKGPNYSIIIWVTQMREMFYVQAFFFFFFFFFFANFQVLSVENHSTNCLPFIFQTSLRDFFIRINNDRVTNQYSRQILGDNFVVKQLLTYYQELTKSQEKMSGCIFMNKWSTLKMQITCFN